MTDRQIGRLLVVLSLGATLSGLLWDIRALSAVGMALLVADLTWLVCVWADRRWPRKGSTAHTLRQMRTQSVLSYRYDPAKEQQ